MLIQALPALLWALGAAAAPLEHGELLEVLPSLKDRWIMVNPKANPSPSPNPNPSPTRYQAALRRQGEALFYEYDVALPPRDGSPLVTIALPEAVALLSLTICGGELHALRVDATAAQWRGGGATLRLLRSSFAVTAPCDRQACYY